MRIRTRLITALCCFGASAKVSEGLVTAAASSSTCARKISQTDGFFQTSTSTSSSTSTSTSRLTSTTTGSVSTNRIPTTTLSCATANVPTAPTSAGIAGWNLRRLIHGRHHHRSSPSSLTTLSTAARRTQRSLDLVVGGLSPRGGSSSTSLFASASGEAPECPFTKFMASFGSVWGSFGVIYILSKGITRVLPTALDPFYEASSLVLSPFQWSLYALSCIFFAYAEGYKGFHTRFAPLVVKRSFTLVIGTAQGNNPLNYLLAPLYSMGLWGATQKRQKISWGLNLGIVGIVALVKRLPPAPRCIVDAGVVVGLTIGSASILYHFVSSIFTGRLPAVDPCLPVRKKAN